MRKTAAFFVTAAGCALLTAQPGIAAVAPEGTNVNPYGAASDGAWPSSLHSAAIAGAGLDDQGLGRATSGQDNVVVVLFDDVSENLWKYMTEVSSLADAGVTFDNYYLSTPWCCPSRATIQSGKYPHNTSVRANSWPNGGFGQFLLHDIDDTVGTVMNDAGYRTGFMGKYLNQYNVAGDTTAAGAPPYPANYVPPGWDTWISGSGYQQFSYDVVDNTSGIPVTKSFRGSSPTNYYTDRLAHDAVKFISEPSEDPFLLMLAPYTAHQGTGQDPEGPSIAFPAAPRDRGASPTRPASWGPVEFADGDCGPVSCDAVPWPDTAYPAQFNTLPQNPPQWMPPAPLTTTQVDQDRIYHVQRIQMLQSADDMLRDVRAALAASGHSDDTWILVTSDNGFHLGEHGLLLGKTSALDHDVKVPLIVYPPGGTTARDVTAPVQNVDLYPTLAQIAGKAVPATVDGLSLLPWFGPTPPTTWRTAALLELTNGSPADRKDNPDTSGEEASSLATTYNALRTPDYLYVDYSPLDKQAPKPAQAEFYDLRVDPAMMNNVFSSLKGSDKNALNSKILAFTSCSGAACIAAGVTYPVIR